MQFGLDVAQHQLTWDQILERVRFAEEGGFTGAWVFYLVVGWPSGGRERLEEFADKVLRDVSA